MPKSHVQSSENQDFHKIWCWLYRTVRPAVEAESTTLFPVLEFVFDRTLACGKTWEVIRLFQFSENLTLHRNTISRNIKRLVALGVILTRNPKHGRAIYAINLNWTDTDMMKIPKRGRTEAPVIPLFGGITGVSKVLNYLDNLLCKRSPSNVYRVSDLSLRIARFNASSSPTIATFCLLLVIAV